MITFGKTQRGFVRGIFQDRYGCECSIQESSLATEPCLWLGVDRDIEGEQILGRMHLTQEMAAELIPILQTFVETGRLGED